MGVGLNTADPPIDFEIPEKSEVKRDVIEGLVRSENRSKDLIERAKKKRKKVNW